MATGAAFGGSTLAEAYTMRKLYKEKMKREAAEKGFVSAADLKESKNSSSSGCFFRRVFKKGHSAKVSSSFDSQGNHVQEKEKWDDQS
ncbi:uncharacterized protein LOC110647319 [Hevea brasiliensis]|uniref:uncharacterized protein LOC110647319 n=1 Tax=Hevea brasiliensis TaxID=3981 RepID=UPI000B7923B5|nr:uncharacterized protein LOC110647319 [Hevea brasiliensis]